MDECKVKQTPDGQLPMSRELWAQLTCPVCMQVYDGDVWQCPRGHSLCADCKKEWKKDKAMCACPLCKIETAFGIPNHLARAVAQQWLTQPLVSCPFECGTKGTSKLVRFHAAHACLARPSRLTTCAMTFRGRCKETKHDFATMQAYVDHIATFYPGLETPGKTFVSVATAEATDKGGTIHILLGDDWFRILLEFHAPTPIVSLHVEWLGRRGTSLESTTFPTLDCLFCLPRSATDMDFVHWPALSFQAQAGSPRESQDWKERPKVLQLDLRLPPWDRFLAGGAALCGIQQVSESPLGVVDWCQKADYFYTALRNRYPTCFMTPSALQASSSSSSSSSKRKADEALPKQESDDSSREKKQRVV